MNAAQPQYDQGAERTSRRRRPAKIVLGLALFLGAFLLWGLFELQRLPYDPPYDLRTLLGGREIVAVRIVMLALAVPWIAGLLWFVRRMRSET